MKLFTRGRAYRALLILIVALIAMPALGTQVVSTGLIRSVGGDDSWNEPSNWDAGVPSGTQDAIISKGLLVQVNNAATPNYAGKLTLRENTTLRLNKAGGSQNAVEGVSTITLETGAKIQVNVNTDIRFPPIALLGNAKLEAMFGASDWQTSSFAAISGAHSLTLDGFNGHSFKFNAANSFRQLIAGGQKDRYVVSGNAPGAFGTGDVSNPNNGLATDRSAVLVINADNVMADTATLSLHGSGWAGTRKGIFQDTHHVLVMNANDTIAQLIVNGVTMAPGDYSAASGDWIAGPGTLSVVPVTPDSPAPAFGKVVPAGDVTLSWTNLAPNTGSRIYVDVWFGTDPETLEQQHIERGPNTSAHTVKAPVAGSYHWRVDSYVERGHDSTPLIGTVFSFKVIDTDGDGFPDKYELAHTSPPNPVGLDPAADLEPDGLSNLQEYQLGTKPNDPDSDRDTLKDGAEITGAEARPATDPTDDDTDKDGLKDGMESNTGLWTSATDTGTNPTVMDTDHDGLRDGVETNTGSFISQIDTGTHPLKSDSDADGAGDWYEVVATYTDPTDARAKPAIPYPLPDPDGSAGVTTKPVRVYILSGQSNMVGFGRIGGSGPGTLETLTKREHKFPNMVDDSGKWTVRQDVIYRGVVTAVGDGPLMPGFGANRGSFGPELGFGHVMGYYHDEPVLVIKASQGNRSIGYDVLPPGSQRYTHGDYTYAGYRDGPGRWPSHTEPNPPAPGAWYAGIQYDEFVAEVHAVLDNFKTEYPQYASQGYEIAGFAWWQGHKDQGEPLAGRYELNLVNLIKALRTEFKAPRAPFVLATIGFGGWELERAGLTVAQGQLAVSAETGKYPEFAGNVKTMEARGFWRDSNVSPNAAQGYHYHHNAETYMLVGDALARGMIELDKGKKSH
jgi:hypothetical protein